MALDISEIETMITDAIGRHGWWVQSVLPDEGSPSFSYTVGFTGTFRHPEILMMGHHPSLMHGLLNGIGALVRGGARFSDRDSSEKVISGFPVIFRSVPRKEGRRWCLAADRRYPEFDLLQVFLPDAKGCFPWDPACDRETAKLQGALLGAMPKGD